MSCTPAECYVNVSNSVVLLAFHIDLYEESVGDAIYLLG